MKAKKKISCRVTAAILSAALTLSPNVISVSADETHYDAQVQSYDDQIADLQQKMEQAQLDLAAIRTDKSNAWEEMDKYDELITYNNQMKKLAEGQLDTIGGRLKDTKEDIAETEQKIAAQEDAFLERMVQNYMDDGTDFIELILGSKNLIDFLTKLDRVNAIMDYDRDIITNLSGNKTKLENAQAQQEQDEADQKSKVSDFENAIQLNQALYEDKQKYVDSLVNDEAAFMEQYSYYKEKENELYEEQKEYLAYIAEQQRLEAERRERERLEKEEAERRAREEAERIAREEAERRIREEAERRAREEEERIAREKAEQEAAWAAAQKAAWEAEQAAAAWEAEQRAAFEAEQAAWEAEQQAALEEQLAAEAYQQSLWEAHDNGSYDDYEDDDSGYYGSDITVFPLEEGVYWKVTSGFGWRDLYGVTDFHLGLDLGCAAGTNVYAYTGGTVLKSEYHWSYGNYVLISHPNGTATRYAHMSENLVSAGEDVYAGQHIGYVGLTGNTYGYHLHFEYIIGGEVTDPAPYLGIY